MKLDETRLIISDEQLFTLRSLVDKEVTNLESFAETSTMDTMSAKYMQMNIRKYKSCRSTLDKAISKL